MLVGAGGEPHDPCPLLSAACSMVPWCNGGEPRFGPGVWGRLSRGLGLQKALLLHPLRSGQSPPQRRCFRACTAFSAPSSGAVRGVSAVSVSLCQKNSYPFAAMT